MHATALSPSVAREFVVFHVDQVVCGLDIAQIQEIKKIQSLTPVPGAPPYVRGLVNMRGQIIALVDVRQRLGLPPHPMGKIISAIIVSAGDELVGLLVDSVGDVIRAEVEDIRPPPSNLRGVEGHFFTAVVQVAEGLVAVIDRERIAGRGEAAERSLSLRDGA